MHRWISRAGLVMLLGSLVGCWEPDEESPATDLLPVVLWPGHVGYSNSVSCLAVLNDYAYVASGTNLLVIETSQPMNPGPVLVHPLGLSPARMFCTQGHLYVAGNQSGLLIQDLGQPAAPVQVGACATAGPMMAAEVVGEFVFVAEGSAGLEVFGLQDPVHPVLVAACRLPGPAQALAHAGHYLCVAAGTGGLQVVDTSKPAAPQVIGAYTPGYAVTSVALAAGGGCVVAGSNWVDVLDLTNPRAPVRTGRCRITDLYSDEIIGVEGAGSAVLVWTREGRFLLIDLRQPELPVPWLGYLDNVAVADIKVVGAHAYLATRPGVLHVLEVGTLGDPRYARMVDTPGTARAVCVEEKLCVVADGPEGVRIYDVSQPPRAVFRGSYATGSDAWDVQVSGKLACVAAGDQGLLVLDITDPTRPVLLGSRPTLGPARALQVQGTRAYVVCGNGGLEIFDVSNPAAIRFIAQHPTPGGRDLQIHGPTAYVADMRGGLWIIDLSNPEFPATLGRYWYPAEESSSDEEDTSCGFRDVQVIGDFVLVAAPARGLYLLDIRDPSAPKAVTNLPGQVFCLAATASRLYVGTAMGIEVLDLSENGQLRWRRRFETAGVPWDVQVRDGYAFVAMAKGGLLIFNAAETPEFLSAPQMVRDRLLLQWAGGPETTLEFSTGLDPPTWVAVPASRGRVRSELSLEQPKGFFRLVDRKE